MNTDDKLNPTEAACFYGISVRTFYTWLRAGKVPAGETLPSGRRVWPVSVLQARIKCPATTVSTAAAA